MIKITQVEFSQVKDFRFDAIIAASGFEKRASYQIQFLSGDKKIALGFTNQLKDRNRISNDKIFKEHEFKIFRKSGHDYDLPFFRNLIKEILSSTKSHEVNIYIDYSSMTRNWYAQLLFVADQFMEIGRTVNLFFGYSFSSYLKSTKLDLPNKHVEPIFGYCNINIPSKPTALIICLGNEINRVYGLKEYFDAETYIFLSDSKFGNEYSREVEHLNKEIIKSVKATNLFRFPIHDLSYTDYLLENVCNALAGKYRVIIAPCGPKPFTLISLINSLRNDRNIEVWKISPGESIQKNERPASGEVVVLKVTVHKGQLVKTNS